MISLGRMVAKTYNKLYLAELMATRGGGLNKPSFAIVSS